MATTQVLYVGSGVPWSGGAGYLVRQNMLLQALARDGASLHLALFDHPPDAPRPPFAARITRLPQPRRKAAPPRLGALAADLLDARPRFFRKDDCRAARAELARLRPASFDRVFAYRIDFAWFAGLLFRRDLGRRLVLDIDDPEHLREERRLRTLVAEIDWRTARDLAKLRRFERAAVADAALALVCQPRDAEAFPEPRPRVLANGVPLPAAPPRAVREPRLLLVGDCRGGSEAPNVDAVNWFLDAVWPLVLEAVPAARFELVGRSGAALANRVAATPHARLVGFVERLAESYAGAAIAVAPIRFGTGTRIKILEAMAHACPVVATPLGAEGIEAADGREILLADGAPAFAAACVRLLQGRDAAERIGAAGRAYVARHHDAATQQGKLLELLTP